MTQVHKTEGPRPESSPRAAAQGVKQKSTRILLKSGASADTRSASSKRSAEEDDGKSTFVLHAQSWSALHNTQYRYKQELVGLLPQGWTISCNVYGTDVGPDRARCHSNTSACTFLSTSTCPCMQIFKVYA